LNAVAPDRNFVQPPRLSAIFSVRTRHCALRKKAARKGDIGQEQALVASRTVVAIHEQAVVSDQPAQIFRFSAASTQAGPVSDE
jgi:hypothetical protein